MSRIPFFVHAFLPDGKVKLYQLNQILSIRETGEPGQLAIEFVDRRVSRIPEIVCGTIDGFMQNIRESA